jgi:hypothetical protein
MPHVVVALLHAAAAVAAERVVSAAYYAPGCLTSCVSTPLIRYNLVTTGVSAGACGSTAPCTLTTPCSVTSQIFPRGLSPTTFSSLFVMDASATKAELLGTSYLPAVRSGPVCASSDKTSPRLSYTLTNLAYACNSTATAFSSAVLQFWDETFMMPSSDWITPAGVLYANFPLAVEPNVKMMLANSVSSSTVTSNSYRSLVIAVSDVGGGTLATTVTMSPPFPSFGAMTGGICFSSGACLSGCYIIPTTSYASVWAQLLPAFLGSKNVCT